MRRITVGQLTRTFLASSSFGTEQSRKWYECFLRTLAIHAGSIIAEELTADKAREWITHYYGKRQQTTKHSAGRTIVRLFRWAVDEGLIDKYPLARFKKLPPTHREVLLTGAQYTLCLKASPSPQLRDVIKFLWHTGCRPQELRVIQAAHVSGRKIVLPQSMSKGKRKRRIILMDDAAAAMIARLSAAYPSGPLFRGTRGQEWSKNAIVLSFTRLRKTTKTPKLCAYAFRHAYVTRLLERGVDVTSAAAIAGTSARMVNEVYQHVGSNEDRLLRLIGNGRVEREPPIEDCA